MTHNPQPPWLGENAIADGPSILRYVRDAAAEHGVDYDIRYNSRAVRAEWSSADQIRTVRAASDSGESSTITANFLMSCSGYYRYDEGYTPKFSRCR